jgi:hypothetical protein
MHPIQQLRGHAGSGRARRLLRRHAWPLAWCAVCLTLAGSAWIVITGVLARHELLAAQARLVEIQRSSGTSGQVGADGTSGLTAAARSAADRAERARFYTSGPVWSVAAHVPYVGDPLRTVRGAAAATDRLTADVLAPLVRAATELSADGRDDSGLVDVTVLRRSAAGLHKAARVAAEVRTQVAGLPQSTWLPPVDRARARLTRQLDQVVPATADVATAARLLPSMMGSPQPRRYLVIFQNSAEARGTGGLPGAFTTMTADRGRLAFDDFGNDTAVAHAQAKVDLGRQFTAAHGHNAPTSTWVNANLSPHFPYAARIWADAWQRHAGKTVDGVIALDPSAMRGLLAVSGPVRLRDGTVVSSGNVVDLTERTSYAAFSRVEERKAFFLDVARGVASHLISSTDKARTPPLLAALHGQLREGRVIAWSSHAPEQRALEQRGFAGLLPAGRDPFAGLVVNNAAGTKLDYYLDRTLRWEPGRCGADGREVTVTVSLTNRAPRSGLPGYVIQRVDQPPYPTRQGDNRLMVGYYASRGAVLDGVTSGGAPAVVASATERGHPVYTMDLELPAQSTRTIELRLVEPVSTRPPLVWRQPLVTPLKSAVLPYPPCDAPR